MIIHCFHLFSLGKTRDFPESVIINATLERLSFFSRVGSKISSTWVEWIWVICDRTLVMNFSYVDCHEASSVTSCIFLIREIFDCFSSFNKLRSWAYAYDSYFCSRVNGTRLNCGSRYMSCRVNVSVRSNSTNFSWMIWKECNGGRKTLGNSCKFKVSVSTYPRQLIEICYSCGSRILMTPKETEAI